MNAHPPPLSRQRRATAGGLAAPGGCRQTPMPGSFAAFGRWPSGSPCLRGYKRSPIAKGSNDVRLDRLASGRRRSGAGRKRPPIQVCGGTVEIHLNPSVIQACCGHGHLV